MTGDRGGQTRDHPEIDGSDGPHSDPDADLDPDVLEELEFWGDPIEPDQGADPPDEWRPSSGSGSLVLVGTPIGNLADLSPRAVDTLRSADLIYCEDTRHSRKLLTHAGITGVRLRSLHDHNEDDRVAEVLDAVNQGRTVVVVSDAGMPGISDPGGRVVAAAARDGLTVSVVPGPSAGVAALVASGLPSDRYCFEGFLPRSGRERRDRLDALARERRTSVLFEAPGRLAGTLSELVEVCGGDRPVAVARELTKLHEQIWRGPLGQATGWAGAQSVRGEVVVVLGGMVGVEETVGDDVLLGALRQHLAEGERTRGVVDEIAGAYGVPRRRVYKLALELREGPSAGGSGSEADTGRSPDAVSE